ncbi:hypothetical protein DL93DRAFT_2097214 [Clavulina sp. PMI_390]|nr:hypothetical protein DL93DRAFT_2097214 [Clavulina sp. PMI_390]
MAPSSVCLLHPDCLNPLHFPLPTRSHARFFLSLLRAALSAKVNKHSARLTAVARFPRPDASDETRSSFATPLPHDPPSPPVATGFPAPLIVINTRAPVCHFELLLLLKRAFLSTINRRRPGHNFLLFVSFGSSAPNSLFLSSTNIDQLSQTSDLRSEVPSMRQMWANPFDRVGERKKYEIECLRENSHGPADFGVSIISA